MTEPAIVTSSLSRSFGSCVAVEDLNLRIPEGEIYGLIGPNGAGKTTILHLLLGLLHPSTGEVSVFGHDPVEEGNLVRAKIGTVLEPCGLYERQSAWENLDYHGRIWRFSAEERAERSKEILSAMGLWERRDERVAGWGRGLKQRLCIARCLYHRPRLALLDEPHAGLDAASIDVVSEYLSNLVEQTGITIVMATNNLLVADSACHSITVLEEGKTLASGRTSKIRAMGPEPTIAIEGRGITDEVIALLLRRPEVLSAQRLNHHLELQLAAHIDTAPLVSLLIESGAEITEVRKTKSTLKGALGALLHDETGTGEL